MLVMVHVLWGRDRLELASRWARSTWARPPPTFCATMVSRTHLRPVCRQAPAVPPRTGDCRYSGRTSSGSFAISFAPPLPCLAETASSGVDEYVTADTPDGNWYTVPCGAQAPAGRNCPLPICSKSRITSKTTSLVSFAHQAD